MDRWGELIALGLDAIVLTICSRLYFKFSYNLNMIERAQRLGINPDMSTLSEEAKEYVIVQGTVRAVEKPIRSMTSNDVTGVVQRLTLKEHATARNSSGFWTDQKNIIHEAYNVVPFVIQTKKMRLSVVDPLSADLLDLDTVHDKFEASSSSIMDYLMGFFNGVRQRGIETTEEMLKEGSLLTGIGTVSVSPEDQLQLSPPMGGQPYFLTAMSVPSLLRKMEDQRITFRWLTVMFGGLGIVLVSIIGRRWWLKRQMERRMEENRKARRRDVRQKTHELSEAERCVVCQENPREVIVLPCGHVSLCEDCSDNISSHCPVCRSIIKNKAAAFIS